MWSYHECGLTARSKKRWKIALREERSNERYKAVDSSTSLHKFYQVLKDLYGASRVLVYIDSTDVQLDALGDGGGAFLGIIVE